MEARITGFTLPAAHSPPPPPIRIDDTISIDESLTQGRKPVYVAVDAGAVTRVAIGLETQRKEKQGSLF